MRQHSQKDTVGSPTMPPVYAVEIPQFIRLLQENYANLTHSRLLAQTHGIETEIQRPQSFAKSRKCKEMEDANQADELQFLSRA